MTTLLTQADVDRIKNLMGDIAPLKVFRAVNAGTPLLKAVGFLSEDARLLAAFLNETVADPDDIAGISDMAREYHQLRGKSLHPSIHVIEAWLAKQAILNTIRNASRTGRTR